MTHDDDVDADDDDDDADADDDDDGDDADDDGDDAQKMKVILSCGQQKYFARSSTCFSFDNIFPNRTTHEACEIKDCSFNLVELRVSNNIASLNRLFYTTAAYALWT